MRVVAGAVLAALVLTACGNDTATEPNTDAAATPADTSNIVDVSMTEYAFGMPDEATAGTVTFNFTNAGDLPHEAAFGAIAEGYDAADVERAIRKGKTPKWFEDIAGIPVLSSGLSVSMTRELEEGGYVFLCFLPTPEGQPHVAEGMYRYFELSGTSDAEMPEADYTITATDDGFEVPDITAGTHTIRLANEASEGREFALFSLEEGKTMRDVGRWFRSGFKTDAPGLFPGGMQSIEPGTDIVLGITFEAGRTYLIEDFESRTRVEFEVE